MQLMLSKLHTVPINRVKRFVDGSIMASESDNRMPIGAIIRTETE